MPLTEIERSIEALLYVADSPIAISELAQLLDIDQNALQLALEHLQDALAGHGLRLQRSGQHLQLTTAPECSPLIERYLGVEANSKLSAAALETLAIIAYKQPITRSQIELLRGVNCEGALRTLLTRTLVAAVGRLEQVGRPVVYATTPEFLQYLGIASLAELPPPPEAVIPAS